MNPEAPKTKSVPTASLPEARAFMRSKLALEELRAHYPKAFAELIALQSVYNPQLKAFAEVTKEQRVSCGPIDLYSYSRIYDGAALYELVGRQKFAQCGGLIKPEAYDVDKPRFDALLAAGKIPDATAAKVLTWQPAFHRPDVISVPT
jgi:hypothetical protein